jgi:hypothetical protein
VPRHFSAKYTHFVQNAPLKSRLRSEFYRLGG